MDVPAGGVLTTYPKIEVKAGGAPIWLTDKI
jgi:hypothetical protein